MEVGQGTQPHLCVRCSFVPLKSSPSAERAGISICLAEVGSQA